MPTARRAGAARDAFAMLAKAPPDQDLRAALERVGFRLRRIADDGRQHRAGSNSATSRSSARPRAPTTLLAADTRRLRAGRRRHHLLVAVAAPAAPTCSRPAPFVHHTVGAAYISAAARLWLAGCHHRPHGDRRRSPARRVRRQCVSGRLESGYRFATPWIGGIGLTPYAAGQFTTSAAALPKVVSGSNAFALAYAAKSVTDTRSELGLRADKSFAMQDGVLTLRGRAAWAHDFNPDHSVAATFQALPGASFVVSGARPAADSALTTVSAEMKWLNGWSASASFEGEFSNVTRSYAGRVRCATPGEAGGGPALRASQISGWVDRAVG